MAGITKRTGRALLKSLLRLAAFGLVCGTSVHASAGTETDDSGCITGRPGARHFRQSLWSGPFRTLFEGLHYTLNNKGFAHPVLTQWLETG